MSKLYLLRHGDAVLPQVDWQRPLSDVGQRQVQRLAKFLKPLNVVISHIFHSGILRAQQTAEIIAAAVTSDYGIEKLSGLEPNDDVAAMALAINARQQNLMLVGHLPFLNQLVSKLLLDDCNRTLLNFNPSTLVCLHWVERHWSLEWIISPELLAD